MALHFRQCSARNRLLLIVFLASTARTFNHHILMVASFTRTPQSKSWKPSRRPLPNSSGLRQSTNSDEMLVAKSFPRTWVPLASAYEMNPKRPNSVYFLGTEYIAYCDDENKWIVCDAVCPHRLAPLREGRINEKSQLECSYHGWTFDGEGALQRIPQMDPDGQALQAAKKKCSLGTYTAVVEKNVLWAWLWKDDEASAKALSVTGTPEYQLQHVEANSTTYTRDLPYSYDTLLENIVDPSHVPWAHHGLQGKRTDAVPINMTLTSSVTDEGFDFSFSDRTMGSFRHGVGEFRAPYVIRYAAEFEQKESPKKTKEDTPPRTFNLTAVMTPTRNGWSRIILFGPPKERNTKTKANLVLRIFRSLPDWIVHQLNNRFLDSDLAFLHYQEQTRLSQTYFMPAQADRCVSALRTWVDTYAPTISKRLPPAIEDRNVLFDHMAQHTDQCQHCSQALKGVQKWRFRTYWAMSASILLHRFVAARLVLVAGLFLLRAYQMVESSLLKGDFKHYENN